jgi:ATP-dependent NAD(P)H-hydrate dehydratase
MVQPVYTARTISHQQSSDQVAAMVQAVEEGMDYFHCILIGPGLGRAPPVMDAVQQIIKIAVAKNKYLVLDADALFMLSLYKQILQGYDRVVLTPNVTEFRRMKDAGIFEYTRDATFVQKGRHDLVTRDGNEIIQCIEAGGMKRPGGIGDVLAGTIAALVSWHAIQGGDLALSCWTACCIVKRATANAYTRKRRAMSAQDVIDEIGSTFQEMVE